MIEEDDRDKIERLEDGLYNPDAEQVNKILKRGIDEEQGGQQVPVEEKSSEIPRQWIKNTSPKREGVLSWTNHEQPIFKKILWIALAFFVLSSAAATYIYLKGINNISADKIDITLSGPLSVSASNPFSLDIAVTNRNTSDLLDTEIVVDYPEGSRQISDNTKPMIEDSFAVGSIGQGVLVKKHGDAILFGAEGEKKNVLVTLRYHVPGSSSVFEKKAEYEVDISSAPVTVSVDSVKELNSNQDLSFTIKVTSNSANILKNIAIEPSYPFGFTFENANPSYNASSTSVFPGAWIIDELAPAESKEFVLTGKLKGEKLEDKYFKFNIGNVDPANPQKILTQFVTVERIVAIQVPFISSEISLGTNDDWITAGGNILATISYKNNLTTPVNDLELSLALDDNGLINKNSINANNGFYSSLDDTIVWNKQTFKDLESVSPGESGQVTFNLPINELDQTKLKSGALKNLTTNLDLTIKGKRLSDSNVPEEITSLESTTLKVATKVDLVTKILYNVGPFKNTGPLPPKINTPTTYTVTWSLSNTTNDVKDTVVTATLPPYVSFEGSISPSFDSLTFDKNTNKVTWKPETIFAGQGYKSTARQVSFKIIFTPSANQLDSSPQLIGPSHFEGLDTFTGQTIKVDVDNRNINLGEDPNFRYGQDKVVQ